MEFYREIDSTNEVVKRALKQGCDQGFCAVALKQTAGYGRQGRTWSSPEGGLYFSFALRPQTTLENMSTLTLLAALSVLQSLVRLQLVSNSATLLIKWPNDIVVACAGERFRKVCGISCEQSEGGVCLGVGINVLHWAAAQTDGRYLPGYLSDMAGERFEEIVGAYNQGVLNERGAKLIAQTVLDVLLGYMPAWEEQGFAPFKSAYNNCSYLTGKSVVIENSAGKAQQEGIVRGVNASGQLLIETPRGEVVPVLAGEAHLV